LASVEFYVRILVEFLLVRFTLFVRTSENYWAVEVRFSEKKVRNAPQFPRQSVFPNWKLTNWNVLTYLPAIDPFSETTNSVWSSVWRVLDWSRII